jgi:hypothetical protein
MSSSKRPAIYRVSAPQTSREKKKNREPLAGLVLCRNSYSWRELVVVDVVVVVVASRSAAAESS